MFITPRRCCSWTEFRECLVLYWILSSMESWKPWNVKMLKRNLRLVTVNFLSQWQSPWLWVGDFKEIVWVWAEEKDGMGYVERSQMQYKGHTLFQNIFQNPKQSALKAYADNYILSANNQNWGTNKVSSDRRHKVFNTFSMCNKTPKSKNLTLDFPPLFRLRTVTFLRSRLPNKIN